MCLGCVILFLDRKNINLIINSAFSLFDGFVVHELHIVTVQSLAWYPLYTTRLSTIHILISPIRSMSWL